MPLPPTGLQQQLQAIQQLGAGGLPGMTPMQGMPGQTVAGRAVPGAGAQSNQPQMPSSTGVGGGGTGSAQTPGAQGFGAAPSLPMGQVNLNSLAQTLAQSYGLPIGRGSIVDPSGNIMVTPDQIVAQSGGKETLGTAATKLNMLSSAIANAQNEQQARKAESALQAGMGLVRSRGRGSAAVMQSGYYQQLADLYDRQEYEAADFSYFILKEQMDFQREMMRQARKQAKKKGIGGMIGAIAGGVIGSIVPGIGTAAGAAIGGGLGFGAGFF